MAGIAGQPGTKPQNIATPNPQDEANAFLADFKPAQMDSAPAGQDEAAAFMADVTGPKTVPQGPSPDQFAPDSDPNNGVDILRDNFNQLSPQNLIDRLKTGLAANDTEKANFLKEKYGESNVAEKDGKIYYRRDPKEKLRPLDPGTLEVVGDLLDFGRDAVTELAMLPGEVGGGALGTAVAGPAGTVGGAIAGRVASVPMANEVADRYATMAGIPRDPSRDAGTENAIGMTAEAVLPVAGKYVGRMIGKRIPGTVAYKEALEKGEKNIVALSRQSQEVKAASEALEQEGIRTNLTLNQVQPDSPKIVKMAKNVEQEPQFLNAQKDFAEGYGQALESNLREIATRSAPAGSKIPPEKLAQGITNAVEAIDKAEGKAIGQFRAKAMANLKNKKTPIAPETQKLATDAMREMGFTQKKADLKVITRPGSLEGMANRGVEAPGQVTRINYIPPKDTSRAYAYGLTDEGQAKSFIYALNDFGKVVSRGGEVRLTDLDSMVGKLGPLSSKLRGTKAGSVIGQLQGELRTMRRQVIESGLSDETEKKLFNAAMDDFGMIRQNKEELTSILGRDMTAKTIVNQFFKGGANKERVTALKKIVGTDSPEWAGLKEEFVNQLLLKHTSDGPTGFNSKALLNDIEKNYGTDFVREVLNDGKAGPNLDTIKNLLTVGKRIEAIQSGVKADQMSEQVKKAGAEGFFGLAVGSTYRMLKATASMAGLGGSKESAIMEVLNREGFEKYLQGYKGKNKGDLAKKVELMLMDYNAARAGSRKIEAIDSIGKEVLKRGSRAELRENAQGK